MISILEEMRNSAKYWGVKAPPKEILFNAEAMFKKALEQDPGFARAYVGLAKVFYFKHYWESYYSRNFLDSVLILSNKALSIDDKLAEAYNARGTYYAVKGLFEKAFEDVDKAIEINPNDWNAYRSKGVLIDSYLGDYVQSLDNLHKAVKRERGESLPEPAENPGPQICRYRIYRYSKGLIPSGI